MFSHKHQKNLSRQLLGQVLGLVLAASMLTTLLAVTSYSQFRPRSSGVAKANGVASPLIQPQTSALGANGKIAFVSNRDGNAEIYTMNPNGSHQKRLTNNLDGNSSPTWSPDGTKIAFQSYRDGNNEIYVMNADGGNQTNLTNNPGNDFGFAWSPDGTRIAFTTNRDGNSEVYSMNADASNQTRLTNDARDDYFNQWFPDGAKIIFGRTEGQGTGARSQIYTVNADGSNQTNLSSSTSSEYGPAVSPDGTKIAFIESSSLFFPRIDVMNADGSNRTSLDNPGSDLFGYEYDVSLQWSPDGTRIFFTRVSVITFIDIPSSLYCLVMNADGSGQQAIDPFLFRPFTFSPDRARFAYTSYEDIIDFSARFNDVAVANADGSNSRRITNSGNDSQPSWQPVAAPLPPFPSPIDDADYFVQEHYRDFLDRSADASGLAFWTNEITSCGTDPGCIEVKRINVSAAFFLSIEFQETGYLVYRMYKSSYGNLAGAPVPITLSEFLPDTREIGQGVIVNQPGWEQVLENNKQAFTSEFVQRSRFTSAFPTSLTPAAFVDALFTNAGVTPAATDRTAAINEFGSATSTSDTAARGRALRRVAENSMLAQQEFNKAFVLMQYFGYLRRNPDDPPEPGLDFNGYNFWLAKLDQFNGNFVQADMVKSFLVSSEYRSRFGQP
ncbi:MAG: DUF4214 domain-containing protein [Pyrinomonadaceae bacterium]